MRTTIGRMPIFRKKESERTKREKLIRDCVFFGLLIFICGICIKTVYVMSELLEATAALSEINYLVAQNGTISDENETIEGNDSKTMENNFSGENQDSFSGEMIDEIEK
jgi:hypothetical protein